MAECHQSHTQPIDPADTSWYAYAACQSERVRLFFAPTSELPSERLVRERTAKAVCAGCPVRTECLEHALRRREQYGIWGGLNSSERAEARRLARGAEPAARRV